jgi:hypothetical protein
MYHANFKGDQSFCEPQGDSRNPLAEKNFQRIDAYFAADEPETELQYRRSLLRLLADLRPQLAELLGGPRESQ